MNYLPVIGLEIHVQPKTISKMFCGCSADIFGADPNTHTCPVCLGLPGALPVPNKKAVELTVKLGLALGGTIAHESKFDRKNYFYPDLPKGYQISQYDQPIVTGGALTVTDPETFQEVNVHFTRIHLEEDTAKLLHGQDNTTLIDFNRSGMPLIEIVTEPEIHSAAVMKAFLKKLRLVLRYAGISDADMEKGTMRLEPNVSVAMIENGQEFLKEKLPGFKVELKNINSFRFAERATNFELERQISLLEEGEIPVQETRGWDENKNVTVRQRTKEDAHDYRYFPEPDIPPMVFDGKIIEALRSELPPLLQQMEQELKAFGLSQVHVDTILEKPELLSFVQNLIKIADQSNVKILIIQAINTPDVTNMQVHDFIDAFSKKTAQKISDSESLRTIIKEILIAHPNEVKKFTNGKVELLSFFIGQVMARTRGNADANVTRALLLEMLSE